MKKRKNQRGFVLFLVSGIVLILLAGLIGLFYILNASIRNLDAFKERTEAYYLCETGASVAVLDIANAKIGTGTGQWTQRTFDYMMGDQTYKIKYIITKVGSEWSINAQVGPLVDGSTIFRRTYTLHLGGKRAFPYFIRGFPGK